MSEFYSVFLSFISEPGTTHVRCCDRPEAVEMAERAVCVRRDSRDDWHVSVAQWGGTETAIAAVCDGTEPTALLDCSWRSRPAVSDFRAAITHLDYLGTAALYRIDPQASEQAATVFLPLWFGLPLAEVTASPCLGGLVAVDSLAEVRTLRRRFRTLKSRLADGIVAGLVSLPAAGATLYEAITGLHGRERYVTPLPGTTIGFSQGTGPDSP